MRDLKLGALSLQYAPDTNRHVKKTLPPSLSGFPGEVEIKYYVKATVIRPKFYQENIRHVRLSGSPNRTGLTRRLQQVDIKFLPIEPPRPPNRHEENYARRKQQFQKYASQPQAIRKTLFRRSPQPDAANGVEPPIFQVDARLPNPAILTCNEPLPLRILVQRLNNTFANVYLSTLQIELIGYTHVRAHDLTRKERSTWIIVSASNLQLALGNSSDRTTREWKVPSRFWDQKPLPNTVAPSFDTCNVSRTYELEVRVGLAHALGGDIMPELIVLPLLLPVQVYSGVAPPAELLRAMAAQNPFHPVNIAAVANGAAKIAPTPPTPVTPTHEQSVFPAQLGSVASPRPLEEDDAPPSYEDAIAEEIGPVDGPRRNYTVPIDPTYPGSAFNSDSKGGGLGRRVSERLFSQNAPSSPRRFTFGSSSFGDSSSILEDPPVSDGFRPPAPDTPPSKSRG